MEDGENPDVFFSYNHVDEKAVLEVYQQVTGRGLTVWLDKPELCAGFPFLRNLGDAIQSAGSAAIFIGASGTGNFQKMEVDTCIQQAASKTFPVIPVLLPGAPPPGDLPVFLRNFHCVDMRKGITVEGIDRLVWGVLGVRATQVDSELLVVQAKVAGDHLPKEEFVDPMGIASIKSRLHALSEIVAQAAIQSAAYAAETFPEDILSVVLPVAFEMRWRRGYAAAIERMLKVPEGTKTLSDFKCEEVSGCTATDGVLSAGPEEGGRVLVSIDGEPAVRISGFAAADCDSIVGSIEMYGRLGVPSRGGMSLIERIGEVPVRVGASATDETAALLFQNREVLAPLLARWPIPDSRWLLADDEDYSLAEPWAESGEPTPPQDSYKWSALPEEVLDACHPAPQESGGQRLARAFREFLARSSRAGGAS